MTKTGRDFKAELVRLDYPVYVLAADIGCHPSRLSPFLNGRKPISDPLAARLEEAIQRKRDDLAVEVVDA